MDKVLYNVHKNTLVFIVQCCMLHLFYVSIAYLIVHNCLILILSRIFLFISCWYFSVTCKNIYRVVYSFVYSMFLSRWLYCQFIASIQSFFHVIIWAIWLFCYFNFISCSPQTSYTFVSDTFSVDHVLLFFGHVILLFGHVILLFGHVISLFGHVILLFGHVISSLIPMLAGNVPREMTLVVKPFLAFLARIWTFSGVYQ